MVAMLIAGKLDLRLDGLKEYADKIKNARYRTEVGFFEDATYGNKYGTSVAYVAYLNEFGGHNPPRPFMKRTLEKQLNKWTKLYGYVLKSQGVNPNSIKTAHEQVGETAKGDVVKTINEWNPSDPRPNKPATIRAKERKSAGAKGKNQVGNDPTRVLHDTGTMIDSITYEVYKE